MYIRNSQRWAPRGRRRWLIAAAALIIAALVRTVLHPLLGPVMPGTAFLIAAVLVEYYCGLAPAASVMLIGLGLADFFFVPPYGRLEEIDRADIALLVSYPLITIVVIALIERLKRAQYRSHLLAEVARSRYEMLLRHENERLLNRRATEEMERMMKHVSEHNRSLILIKTIDTVSRTLSGNADRTGAIITYGVKHPEAHDEDLARVSDALLPGSHNIRFQSAERDWQPVECVCERFATPTGEFLILRAA